MSYGNQQDSNNDPQSAPRQRRAGAGGILGGLLGGAGRSIKMRLFIGLAVALFGVVSYYSSAEKNPVTGEVQRIAMSAEQEMALGLQAAPELLQEMGGGLDPKRDPRAKLVTAIGEKLAYHTEAAKSPYAQKRNFHFFLINDTKTINAFALPGGQIFITRALFDKLQNEAQLAGVLGHEVGHVIHRHGAQQMAKQKFGQALVSAVGVGAGEQSAVQIAQMVNQFKQLSYGRDDELESDDYGMRLMIEVGYDPSEMIGVMEILKAATGGAGRQQEWAQTHPAPESRIEAIKVFLKKNADVIRTKSLVKDSSGGLMK